MQAFRNRRLMVIVAAGLIVGCVACLAIGSLSGGKPTPTPSTVAQAEPAATERATRPKEAATPTLAPSDTPGPTSSPEPTSTPRATDTPAPTPTPRPTDTPVPTHTPIAIAGRGQAATDAVALPAPLSVVRLTHDGQANFIVWAYAGNDRDLLVNTIGPYRGARPLSANDPVMFDIDADGAWTLAIAPIASGGQPLFAGRGDDVSPLFDPPGAGAWVITHDGGGNFIVWLHCAGGSDLIQNEIGSVDGSRVVQFSRGPCCWEVVADGNWSLQPR